MTQTRGIIAVALLLATPISAPAQGVTGVRALRAAAVLSEPRGTAEAVGTVNAGDVLEVLDQREGWYLVRPPTGSSKTWRTGWVNGASVVAIDSAVSPAGRPPTSLEQPLTAKRKGFIFGLGGGGAIHRAPLPRFANAGTTNAFAAVTDLSIGYAPTDHVLVYYSNQVAWSRSTRYDLVGVTGGGVTYMIRRTSPSPFVRGTIGAGIVADVDFGSGSVSSNDSGLGLAVSAGYEFARHWSIEGGAMFIRPSNGSNHTVLKATFNWLFY